MPRDDRRIVLAFLPGNTFASPDAHQRFADHVVEWLTLNDVDVVAGTEAAATSRSTFRRKLARAFDSSPYRFAADEGDCWFATRRTFAHAMHARYRPVVPGQPGPAAKGGHGPRGVLVLNAVPNDETVAPELVAAAVHYVTKGQDPHTRRGEQNVAIDREVADVVTTHASGKRIGFAFGDLNIDDAHRDGFNIAPLTTCWDEAGKHPTTHPDPGGGGPTLDVIASYDRDRRVSLAHVEVVDVPWLFDHRGVLATYQLAHH